MYGIFSSENLLTGEQEAFNISHITANRDNYYSIWNRLFMTFKLLAAILNCHKCQGTAKIHTITVYSNWLHCAASTHILWKFEGDHCIQLLHLNEFVSIDSLECIHRSHIAPHIEMKSPEYIFIHVCMFMLKWVCWPQAF